MGRITLTDFDNMITSKLYGFKDANDYYTRISSVKVLDNLRIPLLGINSKDDPILGKDNLPYTEVSMALQCTIYVTYYFIFLIECPGFSESLVCFCHYRSGRSHGLV